MIKKLKDNEKLQRIQVCDNMIQWLGSPVGQGFLASCGFTENKKK